MGQARQPNSKAIQVQAFRTLDNPRVQAAQLSGEPDRYKIKLRSIGYRLIYEVRESRIVVVVIAVGRRDKNEVYRSAATRGDEREVDESS